MDGTRIHYLDNAATTPLDPDVARELTGMLESIYGNPSSLHPVGVAARRRLEEDRELLSGMLGADSVIFTGGGTEATNLAMRGGQRRAGRILVGDADHPSVRDTARDLARRGQELSSYPVDQAGLPRLDEFAALLGEDLRLVSLLHGNNETGALLPIEEMAAMVRKKAPRAHIHVDAVQAFAKIPMDLDRWNVDSVTVAAHKFHGPKGVGALALGPRHRLSALITGGGQEQGLRSGTENVCGNHAMVHAASRWITRQAGETGRVQELRDRVQQGLEEQIAGLEILGSKEARLPHILSLTIPGLSGEVLTHHLEEAGICVSTGSACSQRAEKKGKTGSHVLRAMGLPEDWIKGALRISFGRFSTRADADAVLEALPPAVDKLRSLGL